MRFSLLCRGGRGRPEAKKAEEIKEYANIFALSRKGKQLEVKKAEEIKEYANIFAFSWRKKQAGSKKSRGNQGICEYLSFFVEEEASRKKKG